MAAVFDFKMWLLIYDPPARLGCYRNAMPAPIVAKQVRGSCRCRCQRKFDAFIGVTFVERSGYPATSHSKRSVNSDPGHVYD